MAKQKEIKTNAMRMLDRMKTVSYTHLGGQAYIPESTDKIRALRKMLNDRGLTTDIEVDGGIKKDNLEMVLDAGANVIVAGSAIFKDDIEKNTRDFMEILKKRQA